MARSTPTYTPVRNYAIGFFLSSTEKKCKPLPYKCRGKGLSEEEKVKCIECQDYEEYLEWSCPIQGTDCFKHYSINETTFQYDVDICYKNICDNATTLISKSQPCHGKCFYYSQFL